MKKHELLKYAYDNYPKGTKFKQMASAKTIESTGEFNLLINTTYFYICDANNSNFVYSSSDNGKWAEIVTDKKPLFIAEDDTEMFENSECHWVFEHNGKWNYNNRIDFCKNHVDIVTNQHHIHRVFGTEENAHHWIEKMNKPKEIEVKLFGYETVIALVGKEQVSFIRSNTKQHYGIIQLKPSDIENISHALKTLNNE